MSPRQFGSLIGAVFGLVYVLVNTGNVPTPLAVVLRVVAVLAFLAVLVAVRARRTAADAGTNAGHFDRRYQLVVLAEVLAIFVGLALLQGPLDRPHASVAWVSLVVGLHFWALAVLWHAPFFHGLGAALAACGVVGLVLASAEADVGVVELVGGALPGAVLLAAALWGSTRAPSSRGATAVG